MNKFLALLCLAFFSCQCLAWSNNNLPPDPLLRMQPNTYGPNIGMDQYGRPVQLAPAFPGNTGDYSNSQIVKENGYGLGIHIDQYGRPVRIVPK